MRGLAGSRVLGSRLGVDKGQKRHDQSECIGCRSARPRRRLARDSVRRNEGRHRVGQKPGGKPTLIGRGSGSPRPPGPRPGIADGSGRPAPREVRWLPVEALTPDPRNARVHDPRQVARIADSIAAFGVRASSRVMSVEPRAGIGVDAVLFEDFRHSDGASVLAVDELKLKKGEKAYAVIKTTDGLDLGSDDGFVTGAVTFLVVLRPRLQRRRPFRCLYAGRRDR